MENTHHHSGSMQDLVDQLNKQCQMHSFRTLWHFKDLKTGQWAHSGGDTVIYSASVRKIVIMMAVMHEINKELMSLDDPFIVESKYQDNVSGCFQHLRPGFRITLFDALSMMIMVSDNTCTASIVDMLGLNKLNDYTQRIGMASTTHRQNKPDLTLSPEEYVLQSNTTTANDVGHLLDQMVREASDGKAAESLGCTTELCSKALEILSWQKFSRIRMMLPTDTKVASKTGRGSTQCHDAGVVYQDNQPLFILAVFTDNAPVNYPHASGWYVTANHIAQLARTCWNYMAP